MRIYGGSSRSAAGKTAERQLGATETWRTVIMIMKQEVVVIIGRCFAGRNHEMLHYRLRLTVMGSESVGLTSREQYVVKAKEHRIYLTFWQLSFRRIGKHLRSFYSSSMRRNVLSKCWSGFGRQLFMVQSLRGAFKMPLCRIGRIKARDGCSRQSSWLRL